MDLGAPHRRRNPLTGEWVLVSPQRAKRPWQGQQETPVIQKRPAYEPSCYLCPGNTRVNGESNPNYTHTFVFPNDHPAMLPSQTTQISPHPLAQVQAVEGTAQVICFSPRHDLTLAECSLTEITAVVDCWANLVTDLGQQYAWVQIFENKGEIMGCSSPHPHGQVWASQHLPNEAQKEEDHQAAYFKEQGRSLLMDYLEFEQNDRARIVTENDEWLVIVPFFAIWPFETLLLPKQPTPHLPQLSTRQREQLARALKDILGRYDRLFNVSFPYSMGWHGAPQNFPNAAHWQLHGHIYPPLLRSATVKKFMVGYELLAEAQRDLTPEQAADTLRRL